MSVCDGILHQLLVTRQTGLIRLFAGKTHPAAGRVAVVAVQLVRLEAGTAKPRGICIIFTQVATVGIVIRMFPSNQVEMIEELVARHETHDNGTIFAWQVAHMSFICAA